MLRLDVTAKPRWVTMIPGLRLLLAPLSTPMMLQARLDAGAEGLGADGVTDDVIALRTTQLLARRAILDWEGVGNEAGELVPVTPEMVDALLCEYPIFEAFQTRYVAPAMLLDAEKNDFAPLLTGTSAAARPTAADVSAPAPSAPPSSTNP